MSVCSSKRGRTRVQEWMLTLCGIVLRCYCSLFRVWSWDSSNNGTLRAYVRLFLFLVWTLLLRNNLSVLTSIDNISGFFLLWYNEDIIWSTRCFKEAFKLNEESILPQELISLQRTYVCAKEAKTMLRIIELDLEAGKIAAGSRY